MKLIIIIFFLAITVKTITCLFKKTLIISELCSENKLEINTCIRQILTNAMTISKNNDKVFDTKLLNPLRPDHNLSIVNPGGISTDYTKITVNGLIDGLKVSNFLVDLDNLLIKFETFSSAVIFSSHYKMDGYQGPIHIWGEGQCTYILDKLKTDHTVTAEIIEIDGEKYLTIKSYVVSLNPNDVTIDLGNLLGGSGLTHYLAKKYISHNSVNLFKDVRYLFENFYAGEFQKIANESLKKLTFNEIFSSNNLII